MKENNIIILFSALDWGLGHSTRSIPILNYYQRLGYQIWIACEPDTASYKLLKAQFPQANYLPLKGYHISYAKNKQGFALKILLQIPKILASIRREHIFVKKIVKAYPVKLIVSDNRYGFYHKAVRSVFITHQLRIAAPFSWLEAFIQKINYQHIEHFDSCWVPDSADRMNIGGKLSHPVKKPKVPVQYMGPLSRLTPVEKTALSPPTTYTYSYLFLLSGPEPQRSILEEKLLLAASSLKGKVLLIRGLPLQQAAQLTPPSTENRGNDRLEILAYANASQLSNLLATAEFVVCRSGYSSVMDLLVLRKKAIYIPTPGQTEQEYLAEKLYQQHWGYRFQQSEKDYAAQLQLASKFAYKLPLLPADQLHVFLGKHGQPQNI